MLRRLLHSLLGPDDASELVNECYLRMLSLKEPSLVQEPKAFLLRTARNLAYDRRRRQAIEVTSDSLPAQPDDVAGPTSGPEDWLRFQQLHRDLDEALAAMPELTAQIFRLRRLEGQSSRDIAERLGVTPRTVQKHLVTALVFLEVRLDHHIEAER